MSLLDNVINAATSAISGNGEQSQAMQLVSQLIQQNGGNVGDLLGKLQQGGLGDALQSWIGTGSNASVDAAQIQNALGGSLSNAAAKVGLDTGRAICWRNICPTSSTPSRPTATPPMPTASAWTTSPAS